MLNKVHQFLKREVFKTRDVAIDPVSGPMLAFSVLSLALVMLVLAGAVFAIVKIVKIARKKKADALK